MSDTIDLDDLAVVRAGEHSHRNASPAIGGHRAMFLGSKNQSFGRSTHLPRDVSVTESSQLMLLLGMQARLVHGVVDRLAGCKAVIHMSSILAVL